MLDFLIYLVSYYMINKKLTLKTNNFLKQTLTDSNIILKSWRTKNILFESLEAKIL